MVTQLGLGDIGEDPGHYHVRWGLTRMRKR